MKKNVGKAERVTRILSAVFMAIAAITSSIFIVQVLLGAMAIYMLFTAYTKYCIIYGIAGLSSHKKEDGLTKEKNV